METSEELSRLRLDYQRVARDNARLLEAQQSAKTRWESELESLRATVDALQRSLDSMTAQRVKEHKERVDMNKQLEDSRSEVQKLRRELMALYDSKLSHLRTPHVSFEQYRELVAVSESLLNAVRRNQSIPAEAHAVVEQAKKRLDDAQVALPTAVASAGRPMVAAVEPEPPSVDYSSVSLLDTNAVPRERRVPFGSEHPEVFSNSYQQPAAVAPQPSGAALSTTTTPMVDNGQLVRIVAHYEGGQRWTLSNKSLDTQYIVQTTVGALAVVRPLGDTVPIADVSVLHEASKGKASETAFRINLYPGETKPYLEGHFNGFRVSIRFGPPDEYYGGALSLSPRTPSASATPSPSRSLLLSPAVNQHPDTSVLALIEAVKELRLRLPENVPSSDVVAACHARGMEYVDLDFPPVPSSVLQPHEALELDAAAELPPVEWKSSSALFGATRVRVLQAPVSPSFLLPGARFDDEWIVSAFAALSESAATVRGLFDAATLKSRVPTSFQVWVNKLGLWNLVEVDGFLPVMAPECTPSHLLGARCRSNDDYWPAIVEKALAKCHGSYNSLRQGDVLEALEDITGCPTERFDWVRDRDTALFHTVQQLVTATGSMTPIVMLTTSMSVESDARAQRRAGLRPHCSYRVLGAIQKDAVRLVLVRLWSCDEDHRWTGNWSHGSPLWAQFPHVSAACRSLEDLLGVTSAPSCCWMDWRDVASLFGGCGVCFYCPSWLDVRIPVRFMKSKPSFIVRCFVSRSTRLLIGLHQRDRRGSTPGNPDRSYSALMISVVGAQGTAWDAIAHSHHGSFWRGRDVMLQTELSPHSKPYYIVPKRYTAEGVKDVVLSLHIEHRDAVAYELIEASDDLMRSMRFSPMQKFDASACQVIERYECQVDRVPTTVKS